MSRQILEVGKSIANISAAAPAGAQGLEIGFIGAMKPQKWLLVVHVTVGTDDVFLWGQLPDTDGDDTNDHTNGVWTLFNDKYGRIVNGKLTPGTAKLAVGHHSFVIEDIGGFVGIGLQTGGVATVTAELHPLFASQRHSG
jgi:hypothetical protein